MCSTEPCQHLPSLPSPPGPSQQQNSENKASPSCTLTPECILTHSSAWGGMEGGEQFPCCCVHQPAGSVLYKKPDCISLQ